MRAEYSLSLEAHYRRMLTVTNGNCVNSKGRAQGVTSWALLTHGPAYAVKYATEELLDFWIDHPRPSLRRFEMDWLRRHR